jgi:multidrug efflux pump subunit AcrA (membrane-fusion protein)
LKVTQEVTVAVEAIPGLKLVGHVNRIAPQATLKNGIKGYATRIILKNAAESVRPGMTASLSIPLASVGNVLAVPLAAVFNDQADRFVYVQTGPETFERRMVELGVADYEFVAVTNGLESGEVVSLIAPKGESVAATPAAKTASAK